MAQSEQVARQVSFGRGRGFRPTYPFKPARRPGNLAPPPLNKSVQDVQVDLSRCRITPPDREAQSDLRESSSPQTSTGVAPTGGSQNGRGGGLGTSSMKSGVTRLKAKYSYKANLCSPLGQKELSLKQGQKVVFVERCGDNDLWVKVRTEDDDKEEGFVPASYMEVVSDKLTQLPWLAAKQTEEEANLPKVKPEWKPYVSAYNREENKKAEGSGGATSKEKYYCKWCDKQLNGPQPYGAHMASKAHREEVELAKEYGTYTEDD
ncbi:uncharacterized protein [Diadema antillarum]|uniref:uncharacterized protein n=1 Tax=Diadema antillarum TaxID=105358 RepID=UPI003A83EE65